MSDLAKAKRKFLKKSRKLIRRGQSDREEADSSSASTSRLRPDGNSDCELPDVHPALKGMANEWPLLKSSSFGKRKADSVSFALSAQAKVNAELKKLLVASVGEDIQDRIQKLVQEKAELQCRLQRLEKKALLDAEECEQLIIQADVWRSKFVASSVMVDELASWKAKLFVELCECQRALRCILEERDEMQQCLLSCCLHLGGGSMGDSSVLELAKQCDRLSRDARLGTPVRSVAAAEGPALLELTSGEKQAKEVLASSEAFLAGKHYYACSTDVRSIREKERKLARADGSWNTYSLHPVHLFSEIGQKAGETIVV